MSGVCIVTGGGRGIGAAIARLAGRRGYAVCVNYLSNAAAAHEVAAAIEQGGARAIAVQADVSREDEVAALFKATDDALGPVTALVNNAGTAGTRAALADLESETLRRVIDVNLIGAFLCTRAAVLRMAQSRGGAGGAIVSLSSVVTRTGGHLLSPYAATKAAIEAMTHSLARELAADGIRVNAVSPGFIATDQLDMGNAAWKAATEARIPARRIGTPEEVAEAALWLLSDAASYVTGAVLPVTGGY
ncbi:MAG TPA: SDR family oxidoreductase [Stellaceae bacterium]|nr:SDR family oxidoreductase [Stellaceae bacterium]